MSVADLIKGFDVFQFFFVFCFLNQIFYLGKGFDGSELGFGIFEMFLTDLCQGLDGFEVSLVNLSKGFHAFEVDPADPVQSLDGFYMDLVFWK